MTLVEKGLLKKGDKKKNHRSTSRGHVCKQYQGSCIWKTRVSIMSIMRRCR